MDSLASCWPSLSGAVVEKRGRKNILDAPRERRGAEPNLLLLELRRRYQAISFSPLFLPVSTRLLPRLSRW